jgi:hypothetical protein
MTWVIGAGSFLGHGIMISDIRISFSDGTEADLLRKAYTVAPYIIAGFAGSVRIGMELIDSLIVACRGTPKGTYFPPEEIATGWQPHAAEIFAKSDEAEKKCQSHILLVGLTPQSRANQPPIPNVSLITLKSPDFVPSVVAYAEAASQVSHIGSGAHLQLYKDLANEFFGVGGYGAEALQSTGPLMPGVNMWIAMFSHLAHRRLSEQAVPGISPHLHMHISRIGEIVWSKNDIVENGEVKFQMPEVASNYEQFLQLCADHGKAATGAIA